MVLSRKTENCLLAPDFHLLIIGITLAIRNRHIRNIWHLQHERLPFFKDRLESVFFCLMVVFRVCIWLIRFPLSTSPTRAISADTRFCSDFLVSILVIRARRSSSTASKRSISTRIFFLTAAVFTRSALSRINLISSMEISIHYNTKSIHKFAKY